MSSAEPNRGLRKLAVLVTAFAAPLLGQFHEITGIGQSIPEFARDGDEVIRAAPYAFAIWGLIYLYLFVYAVAQALERRDPPVLARLGWPSVVALLGIGLWTVAAALDWQLASPVIIAGSALAVIAPLLAAGPTQDGAGAKDRALYVWPLAALGGWLTTASALNIIGVLQSRGLLSGASQTVWGLAGVAVVSLIAVGVTARTRLWIYGVPIAWGLAAVYVAEQTRHPQTAWGAAAGALVVLAAIAAKGRR